MNDLSRWNMALKLNLTEDFRQNCQAIVNVGCGYFDEYPSILELFPLATVTAIDQDDARIGYVRRRLCRGDNRVQSLRGDAVHLAEVAPGHYDLGIIRHPSFARTPERWAVILNNTFAQIRSGGVACISTYVTAEAEFARSVVSGQPGGKWRSELLASVPVALAGGDRYILMCQKS
jgi:hypothetical protein